MHGGQMNTRSIRLFCFFAMCAFLALSLAGCRSNQSGQESQISPSGERRYHLEGKVISTDKSQQQIVVDHKEIPGFMGAMAMPYPVADARTVEQVAPGDEITADVVATAKGIRLENVVVVKKGDGKAPPPRSELQLPQTAQP